MWLLKNVKRRIENLLEKNKIPFEQEKIFSNCKFPNSNGYARFDFFVDNKYLIEYDGIQHFIKDSGYGADLENIQKRDAFKNAWTKEKNIPLIRIPYTHYDDLCLRRFIIRNKFFYYLIFHKNYDIIFIENKKKEIKLWQRKWLFFLKLIKE